jgi:hypothetical protein
MNYYARLCSLGLGTVVLFAGLAHVVGWWSGAETSLLQSARRLLFETRRTEALFQRNGAVEDSLALKRAIVAELLAGRLTLNEAARQFADANNRIDRDDPELVADYLKPTTQEGVYRQVINWVENHLGDRSPEQRQKILEPLEKEFQELFGKSWREPGSWEIGGEETSWPYDEPPGREPLE